MTREAWRHEEMRRAMAKVGIAGGFYIEGRPKGRDIFLAFKKEHGDGRVLCMHGRTWTKM